MVNPYIKLKFDSMRKTIATLILLVLGTGISQAQLLKFGVKSRS